MPADALGGYDPHQHRQIGFTYAVYDRELGLQTFATGPAFPFEKTRRVGRRSIWSNARIRTTSIFRHAPWT